MVGFFCAHRQGRRGGVVVCRDSCRPLRRLRVFLCLAAYSFGPSVGGRGVGASRGEWRAATALRYRDLAPRDCGLRLSE